MKAIAGRADLGLEVNHFLIDNSKWAYCTLRNETKRNRCETNPNETVAKRNQTKPLRNETKRNQISIAVLH